MNFERSIAMRAIPLLLITAAVAGCAAQPPATRSAEAEAKYQQLLAGKAAGPTITCLPHYRADDMVTIDNSTVAFKDGRTVYVNHLIGECAGLNSGFYTLVTRSNGSGLCRGDIADVRDVRTGMIIGACAIGDFTPYKS
jgi:hypothetical protein